MSRYRCHSTDNVPGGVLLKCEVDWWLALWRAGIGVGDYVVEGLAWKGDF